VENILRIDVGAMGGPNATTSPVGRYATLGGRALTSTMVWEEVPPLCEPLGPENKLILAPGLMSGSAATTSGRISVGCKSPLTGGIKEANAGGQASQYLARLGYAAVVLEGERKNDDLYKIHINKSGVQISLCNEFRLLGRPTRHAGRGGVGAVMGAKGIKVIVVDPEGSSLRKPVAPDAFKEANRKLVETVKASEMTGQGLPAFGTNILMDITNQANVPALLMMKMVILSPNSRNTRPSGPMAAIAGLPISMPSPEWIG